MDIIHEAIPKLAPFCQWLEDKVVNPWLNYQIIPEDLGGKQPGTRTDLLDFMDTSNPRAASKSQKMAAESVSSLEEAKARNKGGYDSVGNAQRMREDIKPSTPHQLKFLRPVPSQKQHSSSMPSSSLRPIRGAKTKALLNAPKHSKKAQQDFEDDTHGSQNNKRDANSTKSTSQEYALLEEETAATKNKFIKPKPLAFKHLRRQKQSSIEPSPLGSQIPSLPSTASIGVEPDLGCDGATTAFENRAYSDSNQEDITPLPSSGASPGGHESQLQITNGTSRRKRAAGSQDINEQMSPLPSTISQGGSNSVTALPYSSKKQRVGSTPTQLDAYSESTSLFLQTQAALQMSTSKEESSQLRPEIDGSCAQLSDPPTPPCAQPVALSGQGPPKIETLKSSPASTPPCGQPETQSSPEPFSLTFQSWLGGTPPSAQPFASPDRLAEQSIRRPTVLTTEAETGITLSPTPVSQAGGNEPPRNGSDRKTSSSATPPSSLHSDSDNFEMSITANGEISHTQKSGQSSTHVLRTFWTCSVWARAFHFSFVFLRNSGTTGSVPGRRALTIAIRKGHSKWGLRLERTNDKP